MSFVFYCTHIGLLFGGAWLLE